MVTLGRVKVGSVEGGDRDKTGNSRSTSVYYVLRVVSAINQPQPSFQTFSPQHLPLAVQTHTEEGLSHAVMYTWMRGGVAHSFCNSSGPAFWTQEKSPSLPDVDCLVAQ